SPRAQRQRGRVVEFQDASNRDKSRVKRESHGSRPLERIIEYGGSHGGNLPPLLAAHLRSSENVLPLQLTLTSRYGGNQPLINTGRNLPPNGMYLSHNAALFIPNNLQPPSNGHMPIYVNTYSQPNASMTYGQPSGYSIHTQGGNPFSRGPLACHSYRGLMTLNNVTCITSFIPCFLPILYKHTFWSINEEISRYRSDNLYVVSIKEDTAYLCMHFTRNHIELKNDTPYPKDSIRRIEDYLKILEDIERGPYSKKPLIRRIELNQYGVSMKFQRL
ncbi:hypothetical protein Tco_1512362, partial [Tanacetum coccineum]